MLSQARAAVEHPDGTAPSSTKTRLEDLAIAGGEPAFQEALTVGRPNLPGREVFLRRLEEILDSRILTNGGPYLQEFECQLAAYLQVEHCIAVCNATIGLEIAARALGMEGEVILPSFTFIATAHALEWQRITPVFCDVEPGSHNIDPARLEELITPRTTGIVGVHLWGRPCAIEALEAIAGRRGLHLMFDAAHALGSTYRGRRVGGFGEAEVFSFHATKFVNAFEGGAITTNNARLAERMRSMRGFGVTGPDEVGWIGTNGKMSEVSAAMGLTALESMPELIATNRRNHTAYADALGGLDGLKLTAFDGPEDHNYQYVVLEVDEAQAGLSRDRLAEILRAENVITRRYFTPGCHRSEPYRARDPHAAERLPVTEMLAQRTLALPTGTAIGPDQIAVIGSIMRLALEHAPALQPVAALPRSAMSPARLDSAAPPERRK